MNIIELILILAFVLFFVAIIYIIKVDTEINARLSNIDKLLDDALCRKDLDYIMPSSNEKYEERIQMLKDRGLYDDYVTLCKKLNIDP